MEKVGIEMVDLFLRNNSIETEYKNPILTKYVQEHHSTRKFIDEVKKILRTYITEHFEELLKKSEFERKNMMHLNKEIDDIFQEKLYVPTFSDKATWKRLSFLDAIKQLIKHQDILSGGTILIDSINSLEIIIKNFSYSNNNMSYELDINIYDHFGLDEGDKWAFKYHNGFVAWYILQKYKEYSCVPFITNLSFKEENEG